MKSTTRFKGTPYRIQFDGDETTKRITLEYYDGENKTVLSMTPQQVRNHAQWLNFCANEIDAGDGGGQTEVQVSSSDD